MRRLWLIDGAYMLKAQQTRGNFKLDYIKLRNHLEQMGGEFFQVYFLTSEIGDGSATESFFTVLKAAPPKGPKFQVKLYGTKPFVVECQNCKNKVERQVQKGVDVALVTLLLSLVDRYDSVTLSTGDGDFMEAVEYVRNILNKRVELVGFHTGMSADLQSVSDRVHWIEDFSDVVRLS